MRSRGAFGFHLIPVGAAAHIHGSAGRYYPCKICFDWRNFIYESYRHRPADRRSGPRGHPQGDTKDHAYPGGRPVIDDIGMVGKILLRNAGSVKKVGTGLYIVTEDRWPTVGIREEWN